jgi:hypothetical protein
MLKLIIGKAAIHHQPGGGIDVLCRQSFLVSSA